MNDVLPGKRGDCVIYMKEGVKALETLERDLRKRRPSLGILVGSINCLEADVHSDDH